MTEKSQNGWSVLSPTSPLIVDWIIEARNGTFTLPLRSGPAGFVLAHYALWHAEHIEKVAGQGDDFGYSHRLIAGSTDWSNHASATAEDLNSSRHRQGPSGTFTEKQTAKIQARLPFYKKHLVWGGNYRGEKDEMHFEIAGTEAEVHTLAVALSKTPRGKRILAANPTQAQRL